MSFVFLNEYTEEEGAKICKIINVTQLINILAWAIISMVALGIFINFVFVIKDLVQKIILSIKKVYKNMKNIRAILSTAMKNLRDISSGKANQAKPLTQARRKTIYMDHFQQGISNPNF